MKDLFSLQGKRILITGAGQGIGFVMAQGLAQYGAEIIINDISASRADDAVMKLRDEGAIAHSAVFNVTDADAVENAIAKIEEETGAIDVLFNNAGIQRRHPFTEFPVQEWNDVISVNQTAVFLVSQAVAKRMVSRQRGKNRQYLFHAERAGTRHHYALCRRQRGGQNADPRHVRRAGAL